MRLSLPGQTLIRPGQGALSRDFRLSDQLPLTIDHVRSNLDPVAKHPLSSDLPLPCGRI